ncbi:MAG: hypothetical protein JNJ43_00085 [Anaerolineales bacterium]|nr:hypothetical protein [Anaerolineales bacterium]
MNSLIFVIAGIVVVVSVVLLALMFMRANQINLTGKTDEKPEWMKSDPPHETIAATKAEGEGVTLFNYDEGEQVGSAFAEQIEDILRAKLEAHPNLKEYKIDIGTSDDLDLEYWVNGEKYASVESLPNEELKQVFLEAIKDWESRQ